MKQPLVPGCCIRGRKLGRFRLHWEQNVEAVRTAEVNDQKSTPAYEIVVPRSDQTSLLDHIY